MTGIVDFRTVLEDPDGNNVTSSNPLPVSVDGVNITNSNPIPVTDAALDVLRRIASLLKPLQQITGAGSNRLSIDINSANITAGTLPTVTTVSAVTALNNLANVWSFDTAKAISRQAYNSGIRSRIS